MDAERNQAVYNASFVSTCCPVHLFAIHISFIFSPNIYERFYGVVHISLS